MIKELGQFIGLLVGSAFSPSWRLMNLVLQNYFDMQAALSGPQAMMMQYNRFLLFAETRPHEILFHLFPQLILVLLLGATFVFLFSRLCGQLAVSAASKMGMSSAAP